jgi:hypothetical protein
LQDLFHPSTSVYGFSATTELDSVPMPSIEALTTSPAIASVAQP